MRKNLEPPLLVESTTEASQNLETVVPLKDGRIFAVYKPLSVLDFLLFQEKCIKPGTQGATSRSIGAQHSTEWVISKSYRIGDRTLDGEYMDELALEIKDLNALLGQIFNVNGSVICHDDAPGYLESNDFEFAGTRIKIKPIPWRYAFNLQSKAEQSLQAAYKDIFTRFVLINDEKITDEMMSNPQAMSTAIASLIFQRMVKSLS